MIRTADQTHKERRHAVEILNLIKWFAEHGNISAADFMLVTFQASITDKNGSDVFIDYDDCSGFVFKKYSVTKLTRNLSSAQIAILTVFGMTSLRFKEMMPLEFSGVHRGNDAMGIG